MRDSFTPGSEIGRRQPDLRTVSRGLGSESWLHAQRHTSRPNINKEKCR
jgi:hypothetical protein